MLLAESKRMQCAMAAMGYDVTPSATNFFLGAVPCGSAAALEGGLSVGTDCLYATLQILQVCLLVISG